MEKAALNFGALSHVCRQAALWLLLAALRAVVMHPRMSLTTSLADTTLLYTILRTTNNTNALHARLSLALNLEILGLRPFGRSGHLPSIVHLENTHSFPVI